MKPNFALDLSHDGIGLLHRGADGWHSIGNVSLDDTEFSEKLGFLRQTAAALESSGVTTKLVIPNSQIRFITADAPGPTVTERHAQVRAALEGTTPYDVDDLAYDWTEIDGTVHVAAVARETLDEAESFANEHGFNPVSFVATPNPGAYSTAEPFFGASASAKALLDSSETIEPDDEAIRVLGPAISPADEPAATEVPETTQAPVQDIALEEDAGTPPEPEPEAVPEPEPEVEAEPIVEKGTEQEPEASPDQAASTPVDEPVEALEVEPVEAPVTASITAAQLPDLDVQIPDAATPAFATRREVKTDADDNQALDRIEKIESRLAMLPEGTASLAPKLSGVSRKVGKLPPDPTSPSKPSTAPAPSSSGQPTMVEQPVTPLDLSESEIPAAYPDAETEEQAMTVFGARKKPVQRGKPRYLGVTLMVLLLAILGAIVLWSTFFLSDETAFWRGNQSETAPDAQTAAVTDPVNEALAMLTEPSIRRDAQPQEILAPTPLEVVEADVEPANEGDPVAALDTPTELETPPAPAQAPSPLTPQAAQAAYLDTGIWQLAPKPPIALREDGIDTLYITTVDPEIVSQDAIALPQFPDSSDDISLELQATPAAHSAAFVLDERGLVIASVDGTLTPDGVLVFAGPPPVKPRARGNRVPQVIVEPDLRLAGFRPMVRPADLVQQAETAQETEQLGGYTRAQLATLRPKVRPYEIRLPQNEEVPEAEVEVEVEVEEEAVARVEPEGPVSALAVVLSRAPKPRPRGFAKVVERARASAPTERATAATAVPRNQTIAPSAPSRASVARLATTKNAINLRRTSLIGVYGSPSKRRALVRLSNGRYVKVQVGQRVDGGKVAAIGQSELRYVKGGRTIILRMPKS